MASPLTVCEQELSRIRAERAALELRASELEIAIRVFRSLEPQPPERGAQTVPASSPVQSSVGTPEAVESVSLIPETPRVDGNIADAVSGVGACMDADPAPHSTEPDAPAVAEEVPCSSASPSRDTPPVAAEAGEGGAHPSFPVAGLTLKQAVRKVLAVHPDWSCGLIAKATGLPYGSVSTTLALVRREAELAETLQSPVQPREPVRAPEHRPEPSLPQAPSAEPGIEPENYRSAFGPDTSGEYRKIVKPKGRMMMLRTGNGEGRYLHQSLSINGGGELHTVESRKDGAWVGTRLQLQAVRKLHPETAAMFVVDA